MVLIAAGLINGIVSIIWLRGEIFREVRDWLDILSAWISRRGTHYGNATVWYSWYHKPMDWLGHKLSYLYRCLMCAGTWIGFVEGVFFSGPFKGWWAPIAAGLAYKAIGHLYVQLHDWLDNVVSNRASADVD